MHSLRSTSTALNSSANALSGLAIEVGALVDVLMTIVWDEEQTDRVLRGSEGALEPLREGAVVVVMSTMSPIYCQKLAKDLEDRGLHLIDRPVSGIVKGAEEGTLTLMAGGDAGVIQGLSEAFDVLGKTMHCGEVGAGQMMKLGNSAIALDTWSLIQEVRRLAEAYGMDFERFMEILNISTGRSFVS